MQPRVLKFGGTSMGSVDSLKQVTAIIKDYQTSNIQQVVVCSAMSDVTNQLFEMAMLARTGRFKNAIKVFKQVKARHFEAAQDFGVTDTFGYCAEPVFQQLENLIKGIRLIQELSPRSEAHLTSFGERLSARLLTEILKTQNIPAIQLDSDFIKLKGQNFLEDEVDWKSTKDATCQALQAQLEKQVIPIVTGFFGSNQNGVTSLLGRGGSDFSAAIIATVLDCPNLEIWTDVDGFMSADPRLVPEAKVIKEIGFKEASELCFFGAKILHPRTIRPVINNQGAVWIKNTFNPQAPGTRIIDHAPASNKTVLSLSSKPVALLSLDLFADTNTQHRAELFQQLFMAINDYKVQVDAMAASEAIISLCIEEKHLQNAAFIERLESIAPLDIRKNRSIVCIVSPGNAVYESHGVLAQIFKAVSDSQTPVEMDTQNTSEVGQLIVVKTKDAPKTIKSIHQNLIE